MKSAPLPRWAEIGLIPVLNIALALAPGQIQSAVSLLVDGSLGPRQAGRMCSDHAADGFVHRHHELPGLMRWTAPSRPHRKVPRSVGLRKRRESGYG